MIPTPFARPLVLRVLTRLGAGGPPIHATSVTRELAQMGYGSLLATGRCDGQDSDMSYLLESRDPVISVPEMSRTPSLFRDLCALWSLFRLMRDLQPDVVHTHTAKAGALGRVAARLAGVPVVVHTYHGNVLSAYFSKPVSWLIARVERALALGTDAICVLSPQQRDDVVARHAVAPAEKVHIVPLGMNLENFAALPPPAEESPYLTVGWLGRFVPVKNIPLLVEVMEQTLARSADVRFVIAGDGPERAAIESSVARHGQNRVRYLGWQRDVVPIIAGCDILIQTSRNEGTPVALIQGMAAQRPFVATPVGGIPDMAGSLVSDIGGVRWHRRGILAPAEAGAFAAALCELAGNRRLIRTLGEAAQEYACRQHDLDRLLSCLDRLYTGLLLQAAVRRQRRLPRLLLEGAPMVEWRADDVDFASTAVALNGLGRHLSQDEVAHPGTDTHSLSALAARVGSANAPVEAPAAPGNSHRSVAVEIR